MTFNDDGFQKPFRFFFWFLGSGTRKCGSTMGQENQPGTSQTNIIPVKFGLIF